MLQTSGIPNQTLFPPFCLKAHTQMRIGLNSKQRCQSVITMTWRLGEALALAYKTLTPAAATHFLLTIIFLLIHLSHYHDPTSHSVVMKKRKFTTCFLLRFESIFHESINYALCDILNLPQWIVWTDFSSFSLNSCWNIKISLFSSLSSVVFSSALLNPTLGSYCCSFSRSLSLFFFYILPPPPLIRFLTAASGYLVVVAPGAVWLADCGRQLFGGEPIAAVAEVGHPCADRVISSEHTSVHWCAGYTAWHSCRRWKGQLLTHVDGQCEPHAREMWPATSW